MPRRYKWCNVNNPKYIKYHDSEWGIPSFGDKHLYEMLILESFQAGLSWECILNKREDFRLAYDNFNIDKVCQYDDEKIVELAANQNIIRNKRKIKASIENSRVFKQIMAEFGSFYDYLKGFSGEKMIYEVGKDKNEISDKISEDLRRRGMSFVGSKIIYAYLQAVGVIYSHGEECDWRK